MNPIELKYIRVDEIGGATDVIMLFPKLIQHVDLRVLSGRPMDIVTAGFVNIGGKKEKAHCHGHSYSLNTGSDESDTALLHRQYLSRRDPKYIRSMYTDEFGEAVELCVIVPFMVGHDDLADWLRLNRDQLKSAGFVSNIGGDLECYGGSVGLNILSDPGDSDAVRRLISIAR